MTRWGFSPGDGCGAWGRALRMLSGVLALAMGLFFAGTQTASASATVPVAPVIDSFYAHYTTVALQITQPAPVGQSAVTAYEFSTDAGAHWGPVSRVVSPLAVLNLAPDTQYTLILRAQSADGPGAASAPISFRTRALTEPEAVPGVRALVSPTQVIFAVSKPADGGSPITRYEQSLDSGSWSTITVQQETDKTMVFALTPLPEVGSHTIAVRAVNAVGNGGASTPTSFALDGPTGLNATPADSSAAISFTPPADTGSAITNYEYSVDGGPFEPHIPAVTSSPLVVPGLTNGVAASIRLRAVYGAEAGAPSAPVSVTPQAINPGDPGGVPKAPVLVRLIPDDGAIGVVFKTPNDAEPVTNYEVSLDDGVSGAPLTPAQVGTPTGSNGESIIVLRGLGITNGTTYQVRLVAMNDLGESTPSNGLSVTPLARPAAPTNLAANPGDRKAVVSFTAGATPPGAPILGYEVSVNDGGWRSAGAANSPVIVSNLVNGFSYKIRLRAVSAIGAGAESLPVSVTLPGLPAAPSHVAALPGDRSAEVAFTPGADLTPGGGALPITNYEYSLNGGAIAVPRSPASAVSPMTITGLTNGTEVAVVVRAVNALGAGPWSTPVKVTPGVPNAPTITGIVAAPGQLTVSFTEGPNALVPTDHQYSLDGGRHWNSFRSPQLARSAQLASPLVIGGLPNNVQVQVALRSMFGAAAGVASAAMPATPGTPPGAIPGVATTAGDGSADFTVMPPAGVVTHYEYSVDGGATVATATSIGTDRLRVTGLVNNVPVTIWLRAVNNSGPGPWAHAGVTPGSTPAPPTGLVATPGAPGEVSIAFTPGSDGGSPITGYEFIVGGLSQGWLPAGTGSPVVLKGFKDWQTYQIALRAVSARGAGFSSTSVEVTLTPPGNVFVPVAPARVVDTRTASGGAGPVLPGDGGMRTFSVANAQAGGAPVVPAGATAIVYNLTVPNPRNAGHVRVMPGDSPLVSVSAINFRSGETIANGLTAKIDAQRQIKMYSSAPADVIVDVVGYFVPTGQAQPDPAGGRFTAITPVRVYDADADPSGLLGPAQSRLVSVTTQQDGLTPVVPLGATAVAYNITVNRTGGPGHLRVMPGDVTASSTSTINWATSGESIANGLTVRIDPSGHLRVYNAAGMPVRFLIDVVGYYSDSGTLFYPTLPSRVSDSRPVAGGAGAIGFGAADERLVDVSRVQLNGEHVVPDGATAIAYNLTAVDTKGGGHLRVYPADAPLVSASAVNWPGSGYNRANASVTAISSTLQVKLYNGSASADALVDVLGFYR